MLNEYFGIIGAAILAGTICDIEQKNLIHTYFSPRINALYNTIYQRKKQENI